MNQNTLGERIKHHRKRLGMTQEQLAERMGVSPQAVSKWENNLSCPDISVLPQLAEIFGITVDALLGKEVHTAEVVEPKSRQENYSMQWHWHIGRRYYGVMTALLVLCFGGLWLMNVLLEIDVSWWTLLWTLFLIYMGLCGLRHRFSSISLVFILIGAYFLLTSYGLLGLNLGWNVVVPVCVVIGGIGLLVDVLRKKRRKKYVRGSSDKTPRCEYSCDAGKLRCEMAFGNHRASVETERLLSGHIEGAFGDFTVDFSGVQSIAPDCKVHVECAFGSMTLLIPSHYTVHMNGQEHFASSITTHGSPTEPARGILELSSVEVSFGTIAVRYI